MSFQAYLDNIKLKTGKTPADFKKLAQQKGLLNEGVKAGEVTAWLKKDFDLGHGHAMAVYTALKGLKEKKEPIEDSIAKHFAGGKAAWRPVFETLLKGIHEFGDDITVAPANSYLSILRGNQKMAVVQISTKRMDIGIKLKGVLPTNRFEPAGTWNSMVTHRVQLTEAKQIDSELMNWLRSAYEQNAGVK